MCVSSAYVNAMVLRDHHLDTTPRRLYVQQDVNWNVTALVDRSGNVVERDAYEPYGQVLILNPSDLVLAPRRRRQEHQRLWLAVFVPGRAVRHRDGIVQVRGGSPL